MGIEIQASDREGQWLEFMLKDDKMFEEEIGTRRNKIFEEKNTRAIEEMKSILNDYTMKKAQLEKKENRNDLLGG